MTLNHMTVLHNQDVLHNQRVVLHKQNTVVICIGHLIIYISSPSWHLRESDENVFFVKNHNSEVVK